MKQFDELGEVKSLVALVFGLGCCQLVEEFVVEIDMWVCLESLVEEGVRHALEQEAQNTICELRLLVALDEIAL